jgi:alpha-D-ribose 1-methylphosphonate 5-triphosphate synthase subunit PhnL
MMRDTPMIAVDDLAKSFTLHTQGGVTIPVFDGLFLEVRSGECVALDGPSGAGKSTLLRALYANYKPDRGRVLVRHDDGVVDMASAEPRQVLAVRRRSLGYVSQFLRVIPRVPALDVVAQPAIDIGVPASEARARVETLLKRLRIAERLWHLPPATFSGGEQQRINIARGFSVHYPSLLLDEPTASLDAANRETVAELILEAKARGAAIVGIFHDAEIRARVADRLYDLKGAALAA